MPFVGSHASHEQLAPSRMLDAVRDALQVDTITLHHVGQDQERFIQTFAERVLPEVSP
jgi:hypothetical protein